MRHHLSEVAYILLVCTVSIDSAKSALSSNYFDLNKQIVYTAVNSFDSNPNTYAISNNEENPYLNIVFEYEYTVSYIQIINGINSINLDGFNNEGWKIYIDSEV